ncbi:hypothetical protein CR194_04395 [Salipaludibacillus keqinensis]|uniref:Replicative helicase inhibitor G39P N-terminal domain-containing protein n=1 Tax=Salipaludibacillus keqinensis TaxID=2045207 RepID=A0A323TLF3_9BACI|nr:hypothetical protein [Salipaludibacillus keqinensis]PYZ94774.1 hypothetical protein CR194_04395 [Salipaludibacillus keqinensis]
MTLKETALLLKEIDRFFPERLNLDKDMAKSWHRLLESQAYEEVVARLDEYAVSNKYPPLIYDLYEKPRPERKKFGLSQIDKWEAEASGGPIQS